MDQANTTNFFFSHVLNFYDVMLLITAGLAVLLILPLLGKRDRHISDNLLAAFIFCQGATAFYNLMIYSYTIGPSTIKSLYPWQFVPFTVIYGVQGFLLMRYSRAMMGKKEKILNKSTILGCCFIVLIALGDVFSKLFGDSHMVKSVPGIGWIVLLMLSVYLGIKALSQLRIYEHSIRQHYSNIDQVRLNWLWMYTLGFVVVWGLMLGSYMVAMLGFKEVGLYLGTLVNVFPMLLMSGLVIYGQQTPFNTPVPINAASNQKNIATKNTSPQDNVAYRDRIEDLMTRVKIYQDPELRLDDLADSMDLSPRTVSSLLNGYYQKNFYDFINYYRVMDAQQQLSDSSNESKTVQRVFEDAGFNSKTTFNSLFKKLSGATPSEYRREALQSEHLTN